MGMLPWSTCGAAVLLLLLQQLIAASSSIWLVALITSVQESGKPLIWLVLYLLTLIVSHIPAAGSRIRLAKAKSRLIETFMNRLQDRWLGNVMMWTSKQSHEHVQTLMLDDTVPSVQAHLDYLYQIISCGLHVVLNLLILFWVVDQFYLASFSIGIMIAILVLNGQTQRKDELASYAQRTRLKWTNILLNLWDNVVLNNLYNFRIWWRRFAERSDSLMRASVKVERFKQTSHATVMAALFSPTIVLLFVLLINNPAKPILLGAIIVTLPRLFLMLTTAHELLFLVDEYPSRKKQVDKVVSRIHPDYSTQTNRRVQWDQLQCTHSDGTVQKLKKLLDSLPARGRYVLSGPEDSGKTTFLLLLKQRYSGRAYFLPKHHTLMFAAATDQMNAAQRAFALFKELNKESHVVMILLDEWSADLDPATAEEISSKIDTLSQHCCVIETYPN